MNDSVNNITSKIEELDNLHNSGEIIEDIDSLGELRKVFGDIHSGELANLWKKDGFPHHELRYEGISFQIFGIVHHKVLFPLSGVTTNPSPTVHNSNIVSNINRKFSLEDAVTLAEQGLVAGDQELPEPFVRCDIFDKTEAEEMDDFSWAWSENSRKWLEYRENSNCVEDWAPTPIYPPNATSTNEYNNLIREAIDNIEALQDIQYHDINMRTSPGLEQYWLKSNAPLWYISSWVRSKRMAEYAIQEATNRRVKKCRVCCGLIHQSK